MEQIMDFLSNDFFNVLVRFFICYAVNWIIVNRLYFKKCHRRDFYFTFLLISVAIFFLVYFMMGMDRGKATMGVGLGLFGIFSIMRYRTDTMPVREMTYLFIIVCLSVIHAMVDIEESDPNHLFDFAKLLIIDLIVVMCIWICEKTLKMQTTKIILYDRPALIKPERRQELIEDLEQRTGLKILKVEVGGIDFLKDSVVLRVVYDGDAYNEVDGQYSVTKSQWRNV